MLAYCLQKRLVTPCMGVWIETAKVLRKLEIPKVTPCMGVWIETHIHRQQG